MDKLPFSDNSVKEENKPREPWVQEGITMFTKPTKDQEANKEVRELISHLREFHHHHYVFRDNYEFTGIMMEESEWQELTKQLEGVK